MRIGKFRSVPNGPSLPRVLAMAVLFFAPLTIAAHSSSSAPATHTVIIRQMRFEPAQLTVNAGDSVQWKNEDIFSHTVTANDRSFDSGLLSPGQSWSTTLSHAGTVAYHCTPHPNMTASLVIASPGEKRPGEGASSGSSQGVSQSLRWRVPTSPEEIHPILVNFTAALLPLALLSDLLGRILRQQSLHHAAWWMVFYDAALTPFTAAAGWWWKHNSGSDLPARLITMHQWLGTTAAIAFIVLAAWRWRIRKRGATPSVAYLAFATIAVLALMYQGSLGGAMMFGH